MLSVRGIILRFSGGMFDCAFVQSAHTDSELHPASSRMSKGVIFVEIKQPGLGAAAHSHLVLKFNPYPANVENMVSS